jgi:hypothetical protein
LFDFLIGLAFVAMVIGPAILASIQRSKSHGNDDASDTGAAGGSEVVAMTVNASDIAAATDVNSPAAASTAARKPLKKS